MALMTNCRNCGQSIDVGWEYCLVCGAHQHSSPQATPTSKEGLPTPKAVDPKEYKGDYGTLFMPPSPDATSILPLMTEEERINFNGLLKHMQETSESISETRPLHFDPNSRTALWGVALGKMADHYFEVGRTDPGYPNRLDRPHADRALVFMTAAWKLSKYPVFAFNAGILSANLGDVAAAQTWLQTYLSEYHHAEISPLLKSSETNISPDELEELAIAARKRLADMTSAPRLVASEPNQIRINELARELGVNVVAIIEYLPETGITEKKYLSSAIDIATAKKVRKHFHNLAVTEISAEKLVNKEFTLPKDERPVRGEMPGDHYPLGAQRRAQNGRSQRVVMEERTIVFALLLVWALANGVRLALGNPSTSFKAFFFGFFGFGDSLVLVGVLHLTWSWVADRRTIHSHGIIRRIVFGLLLGWALLDAIMSGLEAPHALETGAWIGILVFFLSLGWSLIFVVMLYLIWNWIAGWRMERRSS
jgi:hypothetical protein